MAASQQCYGRTCTRVDACASIVSGLIFCAFILLMIFVKKSFLVVFAARRLQNFQD